MSDDTTVTRRRVLAGVGATVALAGCNGGNGNGGGGEETATPTGTETDTETDTPTDTEMMAASARVRASHMSPNAPNVDVYVDGEAVLEDVPFGETSGYLELDAGTYAVEITPAGDSETTVFSGDVSVEAETDYTIAAIGEVGDDTDQSFEALVLEDDNSDPGSDTARVRAVHASPDAPDVDITADGEVLFDGIEFGNSDSIEVPAGDYTLEVRADTEENDGDIVGEADVSLDGGAAYTAFAAGYVEPDDDEPEFELIVTEDTGM
ncbi:DUF4397 domain-containing protein [Halobacteriales archaeon QS_4_69_225]|nr:MAG: DUF4397 domain-containing protein [Halobacteriales archaeon QS_4_69_225]